MADGSIIIDTQIDEKGAQQGVKDLKSAIVQLTKSIQNLSTAITQSFSGIHNVSTKAAADVEKVSDSYKDAQKSAEEMRKEAENIKINRGEDLESKNIPQKTAMVNPKDIGYDKDAVEFVNKYGSGVTIAEQKTNELYQQIKQLQASLKEMEKQGIWFGDDAFDEAYIKLAELKKQAADYKIDLVSPIDNSTLDGQIEALKKKLLELKDLGKGLGDADYDAIYVQLTRAKEAAKQYAAELAKIEKQKPDGGFYASMAVQLEKLTAKAKSFVLTMSKIGGSAILSGLKKISAGILGIHKSSNKSTISIGKLLRYLFGIRSLYTLFNKLRGALVDGFQNLAQYSGSTNGAISGLISSLTQLKNSFAAAFAPILTAVAPALNYLIGLLNSAVAAISQLIAALTGQKTFVKATKVQENYAKSLKKTGGAAKEAKGELASFDKLNVLSQKDSSGGGGGGASPSDMFETAQIESRFREIADKLKSFISSEDWDGLGAYMANGINAGLQKIYDAINWDNVGPKITYFANAFTSTFNSLVDNIDWDLLGRTLGAGLNTLVNTLLLFVDGIDWKNLGAKLAVGANGLVDEIQWDNLGRLLIAKFNILMEILDGFFNGNGDNAGFDFLKLGLSFGEGINGAIDSIDPHVWAGALSGAVKGLIDTLVGTLAGVDWQEIGTKIAEFIGSIDYGGILASLVRGIGPVFGAIGGVIIGLLKPGWNAAVAWWKETAFKDGQFTMQGLIDGINQKWADIKTWIKQHIFQPFIDGFKLAFGIHSPSTVMAEMGGYLMDGLINKIVEMIPDLIGKITEIKTKIKEKWEEVKKDAKDKWDDIKESISGKIDDIDRESSSKISNFTQGIKDAWDDLKQKTEETWKNIGDTVKDTVKGIKEKAKGIGAKVAGAIGIDSYSVSIPAAPVALPHLASGTVVPPRAGEFAAVLGDNKRETEVVSPLSTMKQAMIEALAESGLGGTGEITLNVNLDGRQIYKTVVDLNRANTKMTGRNAFAT